MNIEHNSTVPTEAMPRLSNQCSRILSLFPSSPDGRVSNYELASVALKYSSRITDLRKAGHDIVCINHDRKSGLAHYTLNNRVAA